MHLLYLTQVFEVGQDAGTERHFYFSKYLVRQGHQVTAITANVEYNRAVVRYPKQGWKVRQQLNGVDILYVYAFPHIRGGLWRRFAFFLTYYFSCLCAALSVKRPDVIYACSVPITVGFLGYLLSRLRRVPFVLEISDVWPDAAVAVGVVKNRTFIKAAHLLEMLCYRKATRIVALTEGIRDNILSKGIGPRKVVFIPNGVDTSLFEKPPSQSTTRERARNQLHFDGNFVCMYLGAQGIYNALWTILDAAEALRDQCHILVVLVGDGGDRRRLERLAAERRLHNVRFLPPVPRQEAPEILRAADLFLLPNRAGAFYKLNLPNKLFDFLAAGRPIIVAGSGESADLVLRAGAGLAVEAEDGADLARAILQMAAMAPAERAALGEAGEKYVRENYDREKQSAVFLATLMSAFPGHRETHSEPEVI